MTRSTTWRFRTRARCRRSPAHGRSARSSITSGAWTCSRPSPCVRCRACTAGGVSRARRSTSRCARPAPRSHAALGASARPVHLRRLDAARRARHDRAAARRLDALPGAALQARPDQRVADELIDELVATGAVDSVDFKGLYTGTVVDQPPDPDLYRRVVEAFPEAWIEDPALTDETQRCSSRTATASPGTRRSTRSRTSRRCRSRRGW